jgi:hypothetical protein
MRQTRFLPLILNALKCRKFNIKTIELFFITSGIYNERSQHNVPRNCGRLAQNILTTYSIIYIYSYACYFGDIKYF